VSISLEEVRHIAALARLGISDERARTVAIELSSILAHMEVLSKVDARPVSEQGALAPAGMTLRPDSGPPIALARPPISLAPEMRDGFFVVPRLATHQEPAP